MAKDNVPLEIVDLFSKIVQGSIDDYAINIKGNSEKGGNFLGDILFVDVKNKKNNEEIHAVVKQSFPSLQDDPMFKGVYQNEINFYKNIWKTFDDFQRAHDIGFNKIAKYLGSDPTGGKEKIALDNLKYSGFDVLDKTLPFTKEHVELIMKSYGTFHAISFAFRELHPEEYAELVEPSKKVTFGKMSFYYPMEFTDLVQILENEIDDDIWQIMKRYVKESSKMFVDALDYQGDTPLLVQGDCWSTNMMFKTDEQGKIEDMRFLDFQYIKSGSPVYDLSYALYSGAPKDILDNLDFYLKMYHDSFSSTLKKFGCDAQKSYPFEKFKEEWPRYCKFGYMLAFAIWRVKFVDKDFIPDFKEGTNTVTQNDMRKGVSVIAKDKVDIHKQRVKDLLIHLYENKFL